jgi:glyoxylase-like metal-dependent hydrolase (beta-lactamase superfamily II)
MALKIHHLDCGSMCPLARRAMTGQGSLFERGRMPAHCLVIETPTNGLVLVDTGFGLGDVREPRARLGPVVTLLGPPTDPAITAHEQVKKLGFDPRDVRHVVVTHLDLDHAGGLPDFPWAKVHVHVTEHEAMSAPTVREKERYRPAHFAHRPDFATYDAAGEPWNGFAAARDLPGLPPEILAIPLPGHTRGHACIAVDRGDRWLLHAGDAYFHPDRLQGKSAPFGLQLFERLVAMDYAKVLQNHRRLGELASLPSVTVFSAHDAGELAALQSG